MAVLNIESRHYIVNAGHFPRELWFFRSSSSQSRSVPESGHTTWLAQGDIRLNDETGKLWTERMTFMRSVLGRRNDVVTDKSGQCADRVWVCVRAEAEGGVAFFVVFNTFLCKSLRASRENPSDSSLVFNILVMLWPILDHG